MRLPWGKLTRRLPRTVAQLEDVTLGRTYDDDGNAAAWFVAPALMVWAWHEPTPRLSPVVRRRKDAVALAWDLAGARGGRLLDYQRGTLVEQPLRWEVKLCLDEATWAAYQGFAKRSAPRENLARALAGWAGFGRQDARWALSELLHAHAQRRAAVLPLTQSETRSALQPPQGLRPRVAELWALLRVSPLDLLPAHLAAPREAA